VTVSVDVTDEQAVQAAIELMVEEVDPAQTGAEIAAVVLRDIPELAERADEDLRQTVQAAAVGSLVDLWAGVRGRVGRADVAPPLEGVAMAVELVRRGVGLGALLRAWRLGHDLVAERWQLAADHLDLEPELRWRAVNRALRFSFMYVDAVSVQLAEAHTEERTRWVRGARAMRAEMLHRVLGGEPIPPASVSSALGYDVNARHVALIVWADPEVPDPVGPGSLESTAAIVADALGDGPFLLLAVGNWVVWGWVSLYDATASPPAERLPLPDGVRVAVGDPADGLVGFVRSHEEALNARRVAGMVGRRAGTTVRHRGVTLLALLSSDPLAAVRFVEAELGELAGPSDSAGRLRATLHIYLDEGGSPARTSRRLGVNKNTVVYRVNKAEEILGHPLAARRSELDAALRLAEALDGLRTAVARSVAGRPIQSEPRQRFSLAGATAQVVAPV
jgi:hypothetical protein